MARPTRAVIDLGALANNARVLRQLAEERQLMAVIKADAYGHGMVQSAEVLGDFVDAFAVAFLEEAVTLREAGIDTPILVLEGPLAPSEIDAFCQLNLWPLIHRADQLQSFEIHAMPPSAIWLNVDTGMHRLGVQVNEADELITRAAAMTSGRVTLMSHLATAEDLDTPLAQRQLERWRQLVRHRDVNTSLFNSAGSVLRTSERSDWLRPGYLFYGGYPEGLGRELALNPVMRLESAIIAQRDIACGEQVGYGGRWQAQRPSRIATIPIGYADGYPRSAADGTPVQVAGHTVPLAGRVSMDMITVDITDHPDIAVGSPVCLWGTAPGIDEVAEHADTIGYELTSRLTPRVPRAYVAPVYAESRP